MFLNLPYGILSHQEHFKLVLSKRAKFTMVCYMRWCRNDLILASRTWNLIMAVLCICVEVVLVPASFIHQLIVILVGVLNDSRRMRQRRWWRKLKMRLLITTTFSNKLRWLPTWAAWAVSMHKQIVLQQTCKLKRFLFLLGNDWEKWFRLIQAENYLFICSRYPVQSSCTCKVVMHLNHLAALD